MSVGILLVALALPLLPSAPPDEAQTARIEEIAAKLADPALAAQWDNWTKAMLEEGDAALPALLKLLRGGSAQGRGNAAWVLMKRGKPFPEAIEPLIEMVRGGNDPGNGGAAVSALGLNGAKAAAAVPHIIPFVSVWTGDSSSINALEAIGIDAKHLPAVVREIVKLGPNHDTSHRMLYAVGLEGLPGIAEALQTDSPPVREAAAQALGRFGKPAKTPAVEAALNVALKHDDTRVSAARALIDIGASAKAAIPGLIGDLEKGRVMMLASAERGYDFPAAVVLKRIPEAAPALLAGLADARTNVQIGSRLALPNGIDTGAKFVALAEAILASDAKEDEAELAAIRLYYLDPEWVARAVGKGVALPPQHWRDIVPAMVAAAKAGKK